LIVSIDQQAAAGSVGRMTGEMNLLHTLSRQAMKIMEWVEAVIHAVDVNIVDIEQQSAARLSNNGAKKFPFGKLRMSEVGIAGYVFDSELPPQRILHLSNPRYDMLHSFVSIRQRHQVVKIHAIDTRPTQVI
jgi:hypothetical protein